MAQTALKKRKAESAAKKRAANKDNAVVPDNNITPTIETSAATAPTDDKAENTMMHPKVSGPPVKKSQSGNPPATNLTRTRSASASGAASVATSLGSTTKNRSRSVSITPSEDNAVVRTRTSRKTSEAMKTLLEAIRIDEVSEETQESEIDEENYTLTEEVDNEYDEESEGWAATVSQPRDKSVARKLASKRFLSTAQAPKIVKRAKVYENGDGDSEGEGAEDNGECNPFPFIPNSP